MLEAVLSRIMWRELQGRGGPTSTHAIAANSTRMLRKWVLATRLPFRNGSFPKLLKLFVRGMIVIGGHQDIVVPAALWGKYELFGFAIRSLDAVIRRDTLSQ